MGKKRWKSMALGGFYDGKKTSGENLTDILVGLANRLELSAGELVVLCSGSTPPTGATARPGAIWIHFAIFTDKTDEEIDMPWSSSVEVSKT